MSEGLTIGLVWRGTAGAMGSPVKAMKVAAADKGTTVKPEICPLRFRHADTSEFLISIGMCPACIFNVLRTEYLSATHSEV
ncbi:hypothetical protein SAMN05444359_12465 [Neolewinella agarilytica]|uniref:Uncharacterized protein n=1 Tax=Neolewinella agarilytica TaxID=478744 RepID=A0A1H9LK65_9BACT|nr:hypothetical protein SAMN05444359_12465 [Neolewinella agarilytica]